MVVGKLRKWEPVGVVGIVTSVRTGRPRNSGSIPDIGKKFVSAVGSTKLAVKCVTRTVVRGMKLPQREADHPRPHSAEYGKECYSSAPRYAFMTGTWTNFNFCKQWPRLILKIKIVYVKHIIYCMEATCFDPL